MSYLEPLSFCSLDEYRRHEPDRISIEDVETGELYTLMSELRGGMREASRSTVRLLGVSATSRLATVMFHDDKLEEVLEIGALFDENNYVQTTKKVELIDRRHQQVAMLARGYLRDYFDDMYNHMLAAESELQLT